MSRRIKRSKPYIVVFCEGESEQAYTRFLKKKFSDVAVIKPPTQTGLFEEAENKFEKDPKYRDYAEVTDEIWFFYDVEKDDADKWEKRFEIIRYLRKLRKKPGIKVRLLMTTGCIEYWLLLHYKYSRPIIQTVSQKKAVENKLKSFEPLYEKGDESSTSRIGENYPMALGNGERTLKELTREGLPELEDTDERNRWLNFNCKTFTTVQEAIRFLEELKTE